MKRSNNYKPSVRKLIRLLLLVIIGAGFTNIATTKALAAESTGLRPVGGQFLAPAYEWVRRTVSTSLVKVDFQKGGLYVAAKFNANNLRDETVRMALFIGWADGTWMEPNVDAPAEFRSRGGYLTQQTTGTAPYTKWSYVEFYIPWEYFPPVTADANVFLQTFVGLDGQSFVANSWRQYFVLFAS
jgi:hypothetical protein